MDKAELRTPLRVLAREDARAAWGAFWRIWAALVVIVVLLSMALSPGALPSSMRATVARIRQRQRRHLFFLGIWTSKRAQSCS